MNSFIDHSSPAQPSKGNPAWMRYRSVLAALKPGCSEEETRYRCGIMLARDMASRFDTPEMIAIYRLAMHCALTAPVEELQRLWGAIGRMYMGAKTVGEIFRDR